MLSNIDSLHFLIQAAISLTNQRIMLAFREGCRSEEVGLWGDVEGGAWDGGVLRRRDWGEGPGRGATASGDDWGRGLHSSTFQLNLSHF